MGDAGRVQSPAILGYFVGMDEGPHFVPTTNTPAWRGKMRCAYCNATGWRPETAPWAQKHGVACKSAPASTPSPKAGDTPSR